MALQHRRARRPISDAVCFLLMLLAREARCQLSAPIAADEHMNTDDNKFLQRKAEDDDKQWE